MKKISSSFIVLIILIINFVYAENGVTATDYLNKCRDNLTGRNKVIRIFTMDNRSIRAEFIDFISDSLSYFDILNYRENKIPLVEVKHIVTKDNKSVFDGDYYIQNFHKEYIQESEKLLDDISKDLEYNRRSVIALEKIARAQTFFMIFSAVSTFVLAIILIVT